MLGVLTLVVLFLMGLIVWRLLKRKPDNSLPKLVTIVVGILMMIMLYIGSLYNVGEVKMIDWLMMLGVTAFVCFITYFVVLGLLPDLKKQYEEKGQKEE